MRRLPLRSPPRMRGKGRFLPGDALRVGITPAYAGKSWLPSRGLLADQDHPRVCGEKCLDGIAHGMIAGLPPRVRGKKQHHPLLPEQHGITPAYAGKSAGPDAGGLLG